MLSGHVQPVTILTSSSHAILTNPLQVPSTATYGAAGAWARSKIIESFAGFFWPRCSSGAVDRLLRRERCAVPPLSPPAPSSLSPSLACAQLSCSDGYKILSQDEGHVPGFHGDSWDRKTDADRALVWLPRATGMVQIYRAVPSGPNLNCAGRVAPEKLAAGMQRPREVQVPEHGCVRCGTAGEMGAGVPTPRPAHCPVDLR